MNWREFCCNNSVPKKYVNASIRNLTIPNDDDGDSYQRKAMSFINNPCSVLLLGKAGRGKTYFMFSLIRGLFEMRNIRMGDIRFFRSISLDARLVSEFEAHRTVEHFINSISEVQYLFIDDFGLERSTEKAERDYYDLIDRRTSDERVTVFSSNLCETDIKNIYGERISSRLKECAIVEFQGPDLRGGIRL